MTQSNLQTHIFDDTDSTARAAAAFIAAQARAVAATQRRFGLAVSGGRAPWAMLRILSGAALPWQAIELAQVDERVAPAGDPERNLTHLQESLLARAPLPPQHVHAMPVEASDLDAAARRYAATLATFAGTPPAFDLVHLGLGPDGHTASLVPGDPVLDVTDADVAVTGAYQGRRRMTLTFPAINRARRILWLVTGADKVDALARLRRADPSIPAGRVNQAHAVIFADRAAAGRI